MGCVIVIVCYGCNPYLIRGMGQNLLPLFFSHILETLSRPNYGTLSITLLHICIKNTSSNNNDAYLNMGLPISCVSGNCELCAIIRFFSARKARMQLKFIVDYVWCQCNLHIVHKWVNRFGDEKHVYVHDKERDGRSKQQMRK